MNGAFLACLFAGSAFAGGLWLMRFGKGIRQRADLEDGRTISLDRLTLRSRRLGLTGRPDRLVKAAGAIIPEEWKSSRTVRPWHLAQMGVYFALIEDQLNVKPLHGFIVMGDGKRHRIDNTPELRAWVLNTASRIRVARSLPDKAIAVDPVPGQCRSCGLRVHCRQAKL